jgi:hypothetical protein
MVPLIEPTALYEPVALGLLWFGAVAVGGVAVVVGLIARTGWRSGRPVTVVVVPSRRFHEAA